MPAQSPGAAFDHRCDFCSHEGLVLGGTTLIAVVRNRRNTRASASRKVSASKTLINLRLILVSGKTKEFLFSPNDSASDIAKHVYDNWPMDWEEEQVSSPNILRLIYQGRFLHGNVTLGALKLPFGKTTVMHLVARETLPEPNSQGQRNREKTGESNCCIIL
ncbi:PREDICTED: ubiquitin-like protein 3-like [Chrysochloris asiatica]|uniref:Ubiquitin-like protein 3 n=1 Tax=Chrysochloris asiatica TaxID=185453 RepID=A0A9B0T4X0_CHRAS|nr:PREDICTED: ubiquitin-like protein 3-like [Chrysochloris asiatica]